MQARRMEERSKRKMMMEKDTTKTDKDRLIIVLHMARQFGGKELCFGT